MAGPKRFTKDEIQTQSTAVAVYDYSQFAGQGFETLTKEDYSIPFLGILQSNSQDKLDNIASAKPGMLINTVTNEVFDGKKGIMFIPAQPQHVFVEWKPRDQGGGFVKLHELNSEIVLKAKAEQERGKYKMDHKNPKSNDLIDTNYMYGILVKEDGTSEKIVIVFTSTKNTVFRHWMTKANTIQIELPNGSRVPAPLFAHRYRITTVSQKNQKGTFYNFQVGYDGKDAVACRLAPNDPLFLEAVDFRQSIISNNVKAAHDTQAPGNSEDDETETPFK